jgi:NAD(P)-dependent dehydrogenase (short-subunit alcohol dehydrogenase family)
MELATLKAVVSGGASGLGHAVAKRIIAEGGQVAILDVNEAQGQAAAAGLGERARFFRTDVSKEAEVDAAVEAAAEAFDGLALALV